MPKFLEEAKMPSRYYEKPDPYRDLPACNINLLELSRYAKKHQKKMVELTTEEVALFANR